MAKSTQYPGEPTTWDDSPTVDAFTLRHLSSYIDQCVFDDDRESFTTWVLAQLADDATLVDLGWPSLYRTWMVGQEIA